MLMVPYIYIFFTIFWIKVVKVIKKAAIIQKIYIIFINYNKNLRQKIGFGIIDLWYFFKEIVKNNYVFL